MDSQEYTNTDSSLTLIGALAKVPDPRKARGKQHEWTTLLTLMCGALASGQKSIHAMAQWIEEHAGELLEQLAPAKQRLPSASTLYRVARAIDVDTLEQHLADTWLSMRATWRSYISRYVQAGAKSQASL